MSTPTVIDPSREVFAAVGAGRMGRSIAAAFALAGHDFLLMDLRERTPEARQRLHKEVQAELAGIYARLAGLGLLDATTRAALDRRVSLVDRAGAPEALARATVLFEAVPETVEAKREALAEVGCHIGTQAIVASTSSTILVGELAALMAGPQRFLNAHWLNPAYLVPLVEVAPHAGTDPAITDRLVALLEAVGKVPVRCSGQPGYIVPRLQVLLMNEAVRMIEQGAASAADIDKAIRYGFGPRYAAMGVVEFIDVGGVDIVYHASRYLADTLQDGRYASPDLIATKMAGGELGLKTGQGFYRWDAERAAQFQQRSMRDFVELLRLIGTPPVPVPMPPGPDAAQSA